MTLIRRTNPFGELVSMHRVLDRLLEDSRIGPRTGALHLSIPKAEEAMPRQIRTDAAGSAAHELGSSEQ